MSLSRKINVQRNLSVDRSDDVQSIIDDKSTYCTISRRTGTNTIFGANNTTLPAFQCRLDTWKPRMGISAESAEVPGLANVTEFLLLCLVDQDAEGNAIDIQHRDEATIDGIVYRVASVTKYAYKIEAVLVRTQ